MQSTVHRLDLTSLVSRALAARPGPRQLDALLAGLWRTGAEPPSASAQALPPTVARYLDLALAQAGPAPLAVALRHDAQMNRSLDRPAWFGLRSRQWIAARRPGFVWSANVGGPLGSAVDVVDAYVQGQGTFAVWVAGLLPVGAARGSEAIARGELMRWLAEAVYVPWALANCRGLRWTPVDARHADAELTDQGVRVSLRFEFGDDGLVRSVRAADRPRMVGRGFVDTPWVGQWSDWQRRGGVLMPTRGEVAWLVDGRACPYWRGTLSTWDELREPPPGPLA